MIFTVGNVLVRHQHLGRICLDRDRCRGAGQCALTAPELFDQSDDDGSVVVLDVPDGMEVTRELGRREVLVDYRPKAGIRIAPHFYNSDEELERVIHEIRSIVETR